MKRIDRLRFINKYTLLSMLLLFSSLVLSWFFSSEIYYWLFIADFQNEPDLIGLDPRETVLKMLNQLRSWEAYIDFATRYTIYFFPIFPLLPIIQYYNEKNGYFNYASIRLKNFKKYMFTTILKYSCISGLCVTITYIVYFSIGNLLITEHLDYVGNFAHIFGESFYNDHPFLFYLFMATTIYFAIGFTFGMMGIAVAEWTEKSYLIIVIPLVYYIVIGNLAETFHLPLLNIMQGVVAYNTLFQTYEIFVPLIIPLILSVGSIVYRYSKGDSH
ncbi:hypothetical protein [Massilibacterium senegalense]|uniref:hypothetical protein n=1 Tax=Massilibacterium senegalense TaxID=1632858 RepID=UPI000781887C|nr:hypothetical protein [Massilibacterium senegalense]